MTKRRSLTPSTGMPNVAGGGHAMRRGGARLTVSDKVLFKPIAPLAGGPREGWALNESRGGLRAILEEDTGKVELGEEYDVVLGENEARRARIVWLQEEPDGFVVGVEYVGHSGTHPAAASAPPAPASNVDVSSTGASETKEPPKPAEAERPQPDAEDAKKE